MERTGRVQAWAGGSMVVLCVLVGVVEGAGVLSAGSWAHLVPWLVAFVGCLAALVVATWLPTPATPLRRLLLVAAPVLCAQAAVLLSTGRSGLGPLLLVLAAAVVAGHLRIRGVIVVVVTNTVVLLLAARGFGPLADGSSTPVDLLLGASFYALLQAATTGMAWSQQRVEDALADLSVAHVELRGTGALLARSSQAEERVRIARELHDVLGHQLTALALELEIASHHVSGPALEHVLRARGTAKDLLADVRTVVGAERHRSFDLGPALADILEDVPRPRAHLRIAEGLDLGEDQGPALVRAVQEITTNAIRHSGAENLWVRIDDDAGDVLLEARDDGVGAHDVVVGNGLRGLTERVTGLGGTVDLDGSDGFRVQARIPARHAARA